MHEEAAAETIHRPLEGVVRPALAADCPAVALVAHASFLETYAGLVKVSDLLSFCEHQHSADAYRNFLVSGARLWLAEERQTGAPLGYALLAEPNIAANPGDTDPYHPLAGDIELKRIYVLSRCHGTGLASKLMTTAVEAASALGRSRMVLGVHRGNERALAFYRRSGFDIIGTRRFIVASTGYDDFILARAIGA